MSNGKVDTPCFVIDTTKVIFHYTQWKDAFHQHNRNDIIAYSIKANYDSTIINELYKRGSWFEVCTRHEYELLINESIEPRRIIVNGVICESEDFERYASMGAVVILDSERAIQIALQSKEKCRIGIRCNLDKIKNDTAMYKSLFSRFGIDDLSKYISNLKKASHLQLVGLQAHISGNTRNPIVYKQIINGLINIINENDLSGVEFLDIGGGYKISEEYWNENDYVDAIISELREKTKEHLKVIIEPGNSLVRDCACYMTRIIETKNVDDRHYGIVDGSKIQIPYLQNCKLTDYEIVRNVIGEKREIQRIVGCTCKESDLLLIIKNENELDVGDILIINNVGAYTINEISSFLLAKPKIYYGTRDNYTTQIMNTL
ncbi:MAG: hypothetical protein ACI4AD_06515 [Roseburia sp.]